MAPPQGKGNLLGQLEGYSTPESKPAPKPPKGRDMSHPSVPPAPTPKTRNPDLGAQASKGPEAPPAPSPQTPTPIPAGPPVPALMKYGVTMDINQVNDHVQRIADAYSQKMGHTPSAGIVFDLLKSNNLLTQDGKVDINYGDLFGIPTNSRDAMAMQIARASDGDPLATLPVEYLTPKQIVSQISDAIKADRQLGSKLTPSIADAGKTPYLDQWMKDHSDELQYAWTDPNARKEIIKGLNPITAFRPVQYLRLGLDPNVRTPGIVLKAVGQIVGSTADMPYGAYMMGRAIGLDTFDVASGAAHNLGLPVKDRTPLALHSYRLLSQMASQVMNDVRNPSQNPGYLIMDIWAAYTAGAGIANRLSRAAAAEGVRASAKALITKAPPEATTFTWQNPETGLAAYQATVPLSDTIGVRVLQKYTPLIGREARAARLEAEMTHGYDELTPASIVQALMSTSKSIARQTAREEKFDMAVQLTPVTEMVRLVQSQSWAKGIQDVVLSDKKFSLSKIRGGKERARLGIDAMLRIYFLDDPDPVNAWRSLHERMIAQADDARTALREQSIKGILESDDNITPDAAEAMVDRHKPYTRADRAIKATIESHLAQLEALELGQKLWEDPNPSPAIQAIRNYAEQVGDLRETWLHEYSGFSYEQMAQHIAEVGAKVRGENVIYTGNELFPWEKGITDVPEAQTQAVQANLEKHTAALKNAQIRLSKAEATHRLHPGTNEQELTAAKNAVERHGKRLAATQKRMEKIRQQTTPLRKLVDEDGRINDAALRDHVERLAAAYGLDVRWGEGHEHIQHPPEVMGRQGNAIRHMPGGVDYPRGHPLEGKGGQLFVADIGEDTAPGHPTVSRIKRDTEFNRDNTNNYMAALHEIGHKVWERVRNNKEVAHGVPAFEDSYAWYRQKVIALNSTPSAFDHGRVVREIKIEDEANAWLWAMEHSIEPMRTQVLHQAETFFNSYVNNFINKYGDVPDLGPSTGALEKALQNEGFEGDLIAARRQGTGGSRHIPLHSELYREGKRFSRRFRSHYGVTPLDAPIQSWSGNTLKLGNFRMDTSALLAEQLHLAHRAFMHYTRHQDLWAASTSKPVTGREVPIRDISTIPDELREFVSQMERTKLEPNFDSVINDAMLDNLRKVLYPTEQEVMDGVVPNKHVRYVDEALVLDRMGGIPTEFWRTLDGIMNNTMGFVNEPMRIALIFATPAYMLNWLGSAALALIHDGPMAPAHYGRALLSNKVYGGELTRLFDRIAGQTHASALVSEKNIFTKGSQGLQNFWGTLTDLHWRRAVVIKELKRHGLLEGSNEEIMARLRDSANAKKIAQAGDTSRKAMLDFNSLTWPERATLRHMFFVYSFVRASGIWSLRFLRDHGVQSDLYAQSGKGREDNINQLIGHMPEWFMRAGYFAVHPNQIYNPIQWNMPGMLEQIATPVYSIFGHTPYSSAAELLGPGATLASEALTGYNTQGEALKGPGGTLEKAIYDQYRQTFLGQIATKHEKAKKQAAQPLKPEPVRSSFLNPISAAMTRERSGLNQSVFDVNGFMNTWGLAIFRSGITRGVNPVAGEARYWRDLRDQDPAAYHQHELDKVIEMVKRQAKVVGEPVPGRVLDAVEMVARTSQAIEDYQREHKGEPRPNTKQLAQITLDSLVQQGRIKNAKEWANRIKRADTETEAKEIRVKLLYAGGGQAWKNWVDKVKTIDSYANVNYEQNVAAVKDAGLGDYTSTATAPKEERWAYGRKATAILTQAKTLASEVGAKTGNEGKEARQAWIDYVNQNDKPVVVNGREYPSPFAYEFAQQTDTQKSKALASWAKRKPSELTALQTELLTGQRPDRIVTQAWEALYTWLVDAKQKAGVGSPVPQGSYATYFNYLRSKSPEVKKAFDFSLLPLAKRMATYKPIKNSAHAADWNWMLGLAAERYDQLAKAYVNDEGKPRQSVIKDQWKTNDVPALQALVEKRNPGFLSELRIYTGATSDANASLYLTKFLGKLISP